jgi:hypothetical protein
MFLKMFVFKLGTHRQKVQNLNKNFRIFFENLWGTFLYNYLDYLEIFFRIFFVKNF